MAGLIKAALALHHRTLPPSLHFDEPNPRIDFAASPFYVQTALTPWPHGDGPRRAAVSSFGIGGTNAHAILEQAPPGPDAGPSRSWYLLPLSAKTPAALDAACARLAGHLEQHPGLDLAGSSGAPIHAAADGVVVTAGDCGGYGNCVVIDHGVSLATVSAHQSQVLVSVGQQAYVGLGAYVLFGATILFGMPPLVAVPVAGVIAAVISLPVAGLMFRLRGHYFAIGTWVVAEVFRLLSSQISALGGGSGISLPAGIVTAMAPSRQMREFLIYWVALALVVVVLAAIVLLLRSRYGLALTAIRDNELAARRAHTWLLRPSAAGPRRTDR